MVQGVGFRAYVAKHARNLGVSGWVRNLPDGSVEAVLAGPVERVGELTIACRRGPPGAAVEAIDTFDAPASALDSAPGGDFAILRRP